MTGNLRQRGAQQVPNVVPAGNWEADSTAEEPESIKHVHPSGKAKSSSLMQVFRALSFALYFSSCCIAIFIAQIVGAPLYWVNSELYYAYMAFTKQSFGLVVTTMTHWWSPTTIRISGDASVVGQIRKRPDGLVDFSFPERLILIANHQIYTDWLYLWWVGYANNPHMHGYIYILLKESLRWIPMIGTGMMFYGFIFMSRKMAVDQPRIAHRLGKLKTRHTGPGGQKFLDPMWLLLFPEGTNAAKNGRDKSAKWADKTGLKDPQHVLLPRSTGMYFCLAELKDTVDYVYDCTVAYEGIPRGKFGQDYFTLSSIYFQGRPPKSVNLHWRRFKVADIPLEDHDSFEVWLRERWYEKDDIMEHYLSTGRLPPSPTDGAKMGSSNNGYIETEVRTRNALDFVQIFVVVGILGLVPNVFVKVWHIVSHAVS